MNDYIHHQSISVVVYCFCIHIHTYIQIYIYSFIYLLISFCCRLLWSFRLAVLVLVVVVVVVWRPWWPWRAPSRGLSSSPVERSAGRLGRRLLAGRRTGAQPALELLARLVALEARLYLGGRPLDLLLGRRGHLFGRRRWWWWLWSSWETEILERLESVSVGSCRACELDGCKFHQARLSHLEAMHGTAQTHTNTHNYGNERERRTTPAAHLLN